jgi:hypothetical protein
VRISSVLVCLFALAVPAYAASTVTVAQLEQFLTSWRTAKLSDLEVAERLSKVDLSEELTSRGLARILTRSSPGPETQEQLEILAAASVIQPPPSVELPGTPPPDQATQNRMMASARDYAAHALHFLPDFVAMRNTRAFNNLPVDSPNKHQKPRIEMHFASEMRSEIAVRNGKELDSPAQGDGQAGMVEFASGLSSSGEFGAVLAIVLGDASNHSLRWHRWQHSESGDQIAVFGYQIPRSSSHYTVDFCCFRRSEDDPTDHAFRDKPGYHGEIYVDPASGDVLRITIEAELRESDPVSRSAMAVLYRHVAIGGKQYLCPVRSVAISELYNSDIQKIDTIGLERHVNEVEFNDYHKFGSTARILTGAPEPR